MTVLVEGEKDLVGVGAHCWTLSIILPRFIPFFWKQDKKKRKIKRKRKMSSLPMGDIEAARRDTAETLLDLS